MPRTPKKTRGIFQRNGVWYAVYGDGCGRTRKEKAGARNVAIKLYALRKSQVTQGNLPELRPRKAISFDELAEDCFRDLRVNGRSEYHARFRWRLHLRPAFGGLAPSQVTSATINGYVDARQQAGASNATINRELALLKRAYTLACRCEPPKVVRIPRFPALKESPPRKGFLPDDAYTRLAEASGRVGLWMRGLFEVAYLYGWRESELLNLKIEQVTLADCTIRLWAGETKNDEARVVKMVEGGKVYRLLSACIAGKQSGDYVFTHEDGSHIRDFRKAWRNVCAAAGVPGLLFHDLRRTAVRNMLASGVQQKVAMLISGHKTTSVFQRYNIVDERNLEDAAAKMEGTKQIPNFPTTSPEVKNSETATPAKVN
jgi:integrase